MQGDNQHLWIGGNFPPENLPSHISLWEAQVEAIPLYPWRGVAITVCVAQPVPGSILRFYEDPILGQGYVTTWDEKVQWTVKF